jgi:hypothetical protein
MHELERCMAKDLSALLSKDPFVQSTGVFVKSFFITVLIQPSQVPLKFFHAASAVAVCTDLSIEVKKSSYRFLCRELFYRIRCSYLDAIGVGAAKTLPLTCNKSLLGCGSAIFSRSSSSVSFGFPFELTRCRCRYCRGYDWSAGAMGRC